MRQVTIFTNAEVLRQIRRHLKARQQSAADLAREIGVNYQYLHDMLSGRTPVTDQVARHFDLERLDRVFAVRAAAARSRRKKPAKANPTG